MNVKQEEDVKSEKKVNMHVEECYLEDELEEGGQHKKKEDKNCENVFENIGFEEDVEKQEENNKKPGPDIMEHDLVSEGMKETNIIGGHKSSRDLSQEIKSVWTCGFCGRSARGHLNHTCLYCFSPF